MEDSDRDIRRKRAKEMDPVYMLDEIDRLRAENEVWKKRWKEVTTDIVACSEDDYKGQSDEWIQDIVDKYPLPVDGDKE